MNTLGLTVFAWIGWNSNVMVKDIVPREPTFPSMAPVLGDGQGSAYQYNFK
jgi:hypothetical protein